MAQQKKRKKHVAPPPPPPPVMPLPYDDACYYEHHYTAKQRRQHYPFNKAASIALASFRDERTFFAHPDSMEHCQCSDDVFSKVPDPDESSNRSSFEEIRLLDETGIDSLTAILYNYDHKEGQLGREVSHGCYYPHNAILFYDRQGMIFAFMELCFTCTGKRLSHKQIETGSWCTGKFDLLKEFFRKQQIHTGIDRIPMLPDERFAPQLITK